MENTVPVRVRDCACPGRPHTKEGDVVYLKPMLGLDGGAAAEIDLAMVDEVPEERRVTTLFARWAVTFVRYGAVGWNFVQKGKEGPEPKPFDVEELIADYRVSRLVADKASDLYSEAVTGPLVVAAAAAISSRDGQTTASTSPTPNRKQRRSASSSGRGSDGAPSPVTQ